LIVLSKIGRWTLGYHPQQQHEPMRGAIVTPAPKFVACRSGITSFSKRADHPLKLTGQWVTGHEEGGIPQCPRDVAVNLSGTATRGVIYHLISNQSNA
jgi:hypothetical protein